MYKHLHTGVFDSLCDVIMTEFAQGQDSTLHFCPPPFLGPKPVPFESQRKVLYTEYVGAVGEGPVRTEKRALICSKDYCMRV